MLVFNYGSNLSKEQFLRRCPTATLVGVASIRDHRLTFSGWSFGRDGSVATIVPAEGSTVLGAVYSLSSPEDVRALDSAEGFPSSYGCEEFTAHVKIGKRTKPRQVWVYVKVDAREGQPHSDYLKVVAQGYKDHGLPMTALAEAITALPPTTLKPKPAPLRQRSGGKEWDWHKGWIKAEPKKGPSTPPKRRPGKKPRHPKKGKKAKGKKGKKAQSIVISVRVCSGKNCKEDLVDPCSYCAVTVCWHCRHCCPQAAPWGGVIY